MGFFDKLKEVIKVDEKEEYANRFEHTLIGINGAGKDAYIDALFMIKQMIFNGEIDKARKYYNVLIVRENDLIRSIKYNLRMERLDIDKDLEVD